MRRINPRLGPCELSDLMSDSGNWDLLAQIHEHPNTWPELDQWAAHAIADPETAGAPPEPLTDRKSKHRLLPITPIIDDKLPRDARDNDTLVSESDKQKGSTIDTPMGIGEHAEDDASLSESSADSTDEVAVHRYIPFTRISGIMLILVIVAGSTAGLVMAKKDYDHQKALTSCNQAIKQTGTVRIEWNKALEQAEPYAKLQDKDVQDPKSLELLSKIMQYQPPASTENCDPNLTADRLNRNRAETEKTNNQLRIQIRNLHDTVDTVKVSQEQQQIDNAQSILSQTVEDADRLCKESENKVRDNDTRVRLNEQIAHARLMMHDHQNLDAYNRAIQDLNEVMQIVRDSMTAVENEEISDAAVRMVPHSRDRIPNHRTDNPHHHRKVYPSQLRKTIPPGMCPDNQQPLHSPIG